MTRSECRKKSYTMGHVASRFKIMDKEHFFGWAERSWRANLAQSGLGPLQNPAVAMAFSRGKVWRATGRFGTRFAGLVSTVGEPMRLDPSCGGCCRAA